MPTKTEAADTACPIDRLPPRATEAEEAVLGSLLIDPEALEKIQGDLQPSDFYRTSNASIFESVLALAARGEGADFVTLSEELRSRGTYDQIGGLVYLSHLVGVVATAAHVEHYARRVAQAAVRRRLISAAGRIAGLAYDETTELESVLASAASEVAAVGAGLGEQDVFSPAEQAMKMAVIAEQLARGRPIGLQTGFPDLDRVTGGLRRGCLYVVGAMTGVGKTSWMASVANHVASSGRKVLFASSEMSDEELAKRETAARMKRSWLEVEEELSKPAQHPETAAAFGQALTRLQSEGFHVFHRGRITSDRIQRRAARLAATEGLDLIVVDYLQRLSDPMPRGMDRADVVQAIAMNLKSVAGELNLPVLVAAQFGRKVLERPLTERHPRLSDFRESGGIEQEADVALGLYRPSYCDDKADPSEAWLYLLKNRHGRAELKFRMNWRSAICRYDAYSSEAPW